jgi:hypothetical protein
MYFRNSRINVMIPQPTDLLLNFEINNGTLSILKFQKVNVILLYSTLQNWGGLYLYVVGDGGSLVDITCHKMLAL